MILVAITGSIGMGKSTTALLFAEAGIPVFDADQTVHALYAKDGAAVELIRAWLPEVIQDGAVDRKRLAAHLSNNKADFATLEKLVHPLVAEQRAAWTKQKQQDGAEMVLYDIPLLFEGGGEALIDLVVLVSASADVQRKRVLARPEMTTAKFEQILSRQMPDSEKREKADYLILTEQGIEDARLQVAAVLRHIRQGLIRKKPDNPKMVPGV
ncbi:MAG: dephospho-CoA kinase [Robiginitomaculum sp.]|nr:MAG: dephospho-CoA kinase [Robiginitomaculum sp.]